MTTISATARRIRTRARHILTRRAADAERASKLDDLRQRLQLDAQNLRDFERTLDSRASIVVVASGVIVAASSAGAASSNAIAVIATVAGAMVAVVLAIVSLMRGSRPDRRLIYSARPWQLHDPAGYAATIHDEIRESQDAARGRLRFLNAAYVSAAIGMAGLAANLIAPAIQRIASG